MGLFYHYKICVSVKLGIIAAREKIKEAYEHGFRHIRLIHGSTDIRHKKDGGSIKFTLRSMLRSGELARWVQEKESKNHRIRDESITLALRPNPAPVDRDWKEMPLCDY